METVSKLITIDFEARKHISTEEVTLPELSPLDKATNIRHRLDMRIEGLQKSLTDTLNPQELIIFRHTGVIPHRCLNLKQAILKTAVQQRLARITELALISNQVQSEMPSPTK